MNITCPYTGLRYSLPGFSDATASVPHPLFSLPLSGLHAQAANPDIAGDGLQSGLLFLGYLHATRLCTIAEPIKLHALPADILTLNFPKLVQLADTLSRAPAKIKSLPAFSFRNDNVEALVNWLTVCAEITEYGRALGLTSDPEEQAYIKALVTRKKQRTQRLEVIAAGAVHDLIIHCPEFGARAQKDTQDYLTGKRGLGLAQLKTLKAQCLAYLPESDSQEYARKQAFIGKLDASIADALDLAHALEDSPRQVAEDARALLASYTIVTADAEIRTVSNEITDTLKGILASEVQCSEVAVKPKSQPAGAPASTSKLAEMLRAKGIAI